MKESGTNVKRGAYSKAVIDDGTLNEYNGHFIWSYHGTSNRFSRVNSDK